jgi:hypothetical protein
VQSSKTELVSDEPAASIMMVGDETGESRFLSHADNIIPDYTESHVKTVIFTVTTVRA